MSVPASNTVQNNTTNPANAAATTTPLPSVNTLLQAAKLAIEQDRAIMLDYFCETASGKAFIGEDADTKERVLVKSKEEFTSTIKKVYKSEVDYIILTENSLYVISGITDCP